MDLEKQNYSLKTAVIIMSILLIGCFVYIFKFADDTKTLVTTVKKVKTEKEIVTERLQKLKASYEEAISKKTAMSDELIIERDKIDALLTQLKTSTVNPQQLAQIQAQSLALESNNKQLIAKNEVAFAAQSSPETIKIRIDSVVATKKEIIKSNKTLVAQFTDLKKNVAAAAKLVVVNLSVKAFKVRDSGKEVETEKASRTEELKITFTIPENVLALAESKTFNIQVIDSKNNVLGEKKEVKFGEKILTYSFEKAVDYKNKTIDILENFMVENLEEGDFFINIFQKGDLVSTTKINLK